MRSLIFLFLLTFSVGLCAQSGFISITDTGELQYSARSVFPCSDGGAIVIGDITTGVEEIYLITRISRIDSQGNNIWSTDFTSEHATGIDIDSNDNVNFITVNMYDPCSIVLWQVSAYGVISQSYPPFEIQYEGIVLNKATRMPDDSIVAVGKRLHLWGDVHSEVCFFHISAAGDTLESSSFPMDSDYITFDGGAKDVAVSTDGNFYLTCNQTPGIETILEISPQGYLINRFDFSNGFMGVYSICREPNTNDYILAGSCYNDQSYISKCYRFDGGNISYMFDLIQFDNIYSLMAVADGIVFCGIDAGSISGRIMKTDYSGNSIWGRTQSGDNDISFDSFNELSSNLLTIDSSGYTYWAWSDFNDQIVIKLRPNGEVANDDPTTPDLSDNLQVSVSPNPLTSDGAINYQIKYPAVWEQNQGKIEIFNIKGQIVLTQSIPQNQSTTMKSIALPDLPNGIYLFRVKAGKCTAASKFSIVK